MIGSSRPAGKQGAYSVPTSIGVWQRVRDREMKRGLCADLFQHIVFINFTVNNPLLWVLSVFMAFTAIAWSLICTLPLDQWFLSRVIFAPPHPTRTFGNVWRHLGLSQWVVGGVGYGHLVGRGQGCYSKSYNAQDSPL